MGQLTQIIPFAGVLVSFAILPGLLPRFWHRRMASIIGLWVVLGFLLQTFERGGRAAALALWQVTLAEFLPFIVLLLALYALGGGISIRGGALGRPVGNLLLLIAGTVLASVMGTIGAALLLIHPLLAANGYRYEKRHLVFAFIILVGNCGGALSPLGDPPLLVGYLRGVPFFWPFTHLLLPLLLLAVPVLALTFGLDAWLARREPRRRPERLRVRGLLNILLLLLLIAVIPLEGIWHPGNVTVLWATIPGEHLAVMLVEAGCILVSELFTPNSIRSQNRFAWQAMREIIILFFAIFATIGPAFTLLQAAQIPPLPLAWFWASGIASAVLDAAPTYLIFFQAAGGHAAALTQGPARLLTAIAAGSVFFGPVTYLGNAPNLMIREIAARRGVRMPGFFAFAGIMILVLVPIYGLMSLVFF
ncbi:sodium:proton antiporter [Acidocella sp.]|jgi:Na+/H+ antiporter NhaD/arsenite permease-like protein|uniref:sodium:proton antiporter n=1 Tax=Acidocella sp. TaxID=50710 RepID=UPI002F40336E